MIDTSGLEPFLPSGTIQARATALTAKVLSRSDITLLLIDGRWVPLPAAGEAQRQLACCMLHAAG